MPSTASGDSRSIRNAARPEAGAVLRAAGSLSICAAGSQSSCAVMVADSRPLVITQNLSAAASGASRSTVCWIMLRSPSSTKTCLARARRLSGQNRVPLPPARMIGRKSMFAFVKSFSSVSRIFSCLIRGTAWLRDDPDHLGPARSRKTPRPRVSRNNCRLAAGEQNWLFRTAIGEERHLALGYKQYLGAIVELVALAFAVRKRTCPRLFQSESVDPEVRDIDQLSATIFNHRLNFSSASVQPHRLHRTVNVELTRAAVVVHPIGKVGVLL